MNTSSDYSYPLDMDWSTEEIVTVVEFYEAVERAFTEGVPASVFRDKYRAFKTVVTTKAEEKQWFHKFRDVSGLEPFYAVKQLNTNCSVISVD